MDEEYDDFNLKHINKRWQQYIDTVAQVHPLLLKTFEIVKSRNIKIENAIDIGCGPGNESNFLVEQNIKTLAFDYNDKCIDKIESRFPNLIDNTFFSFQNSRIENFDWLKSDLMVSLKVLPFLNKEVYQNTLENIKYNLNSNGIFVGSVFGTNDDWQHLNLVSAESIKSDFKEYEELYFKETKGELKAVSGKTKKAHIIEFIYRKK